MRLRTRFLRRFEGQISLPGGINLTGVGKLGVVFVAVFAIGTGVIWLAPWERKVKVPALVGATRADAEKQLKKAQLMLGGIQYEASAESPGTVLRTDPRIGTELDRDSGVNLVLAMPLGSAPAPADVQSSNTLPEQVRPPDVPGNDDGASGTDNRGAGNGGTSNNGGGTGTNGDGNGGNQSGSANSGTADSGIGQQGMKPSNQPQAKVLVGAGSADPDPDRNSCATGYQTNFAQQVSMTEAGRVTYRWLRSDGALAPVEYLDFTGPSTKTVRDYWQRWGGEGDTVSGWQQLEVLTPVSVRGDQLSFEHRCHDAPD